MGSATLAWPAFEKKIDLVRHGISDLIGARPDQVAIMPNASIAAYQIASTLAYDARNEILYCDQEFPSIAHVWLAQQHRGAIPVKTTILGDHKHIMRQYEKSLSRGSKLVSVPHVSYQTGQMLPVETIAERARACGAKVFVDAYQSVGVLDVNVERLGCDYLVGGTMKYLLGLPGLAFLYVRDSGRQDVDPQLTGWFGRKRPFDFDADTLDFDDSARRFETGTPSVPSIYGAYGGIETLLRANLGEVRRHVSDLVAYASSRLHGIGEKLVVMPRPGEHGAHIAIYENDPLAIASYLHKRRIITSPRGAMLRLSFHYYSSRADVDACCDAVAAYRSR
jgi:selenocysteine lyase/cysteine desulfurase